MMQRRVRVLLAVLVIIVVLLSLFVTRREPFESSSRDHSYEIDEDNLDVFLINLEKNKDRLIHFRREYGRSDLRSIPFERFDAVDGRKLILEDVVTPLALKEINEPYRTKHYQLSRGAVGCYLSHLALYERIAAGDKPYALIFEDDVTFDEDILRSVNRALPDLPDDWDVLLLGCTCIKCDVQDVHYDVRRFFLMHAYVIKRDAAKSMSAYLSKKLVSQQLDSELSDMASHGRINVVCMRRAIAHQGDFPTDIQTPIIDVAGIDPFEPVQRDETLVEPRRPPISWHVPDGMLS